MSGAKFTDEFKRDAVAQVEDRGYSVREVIDVCRAVTGHVIPAATAPRRAGDPPRLVADSSLARSELGWNPRFDDLASLVASAWAWHSAHPDGYAS